MKTLKRLLLAFTGLSLLTLLPPVQAQSYLTEGLVAYYPFNGNANDASGSGNNGNVIGAQLAADRFGSASSSYSFNGIDNYINVPNSPSFNFGEHITISAWIDADYLRPSQAAGGMPVAVVSKGYDGGTMDWHFAVNGQQQRPVIAINDGWVYWDSTPVVQAQVWQQVVYTYDGSAMKTYLNGVQTGQQAASGTFRVSASPLWIGAYYPSYFACFFPGKLDDIRIYNRALSQAEVQALFTLESTPPVPHRATAKVQIVNGYVVGFTMTDHGYGYSDTEPPAVRIRDAVGTGAVAHAVVENGLVVRIEIDNNGRNYTGNATVLIATPPFWPTMSVFVSRITVKMAVVLGRKYQLDVSSDMQTWSPFGDPFVAEEEEITQEFPVTETQKFFRIREVQ
ncbi:MAG TPA: LamG domain-containing protein [Verrucomicrobiota bacterium]|nr:LamG domain-containing protein [Verrucomicrobiota bacterium]HNU51261.1 LamG domain-containing protein [Verrucomicrobiota bacterium]